MDDGEIELSDPVFSPNTNSSNNSLQGSASVDSILDEFLNHARTCTHTHTCNPPGPDTTTHTHTCYHAHTQVFSSGKDTKDQSNTSSLKPRRPLGNREAVRKYREKKKAHTAYLEEEVKKLQVMNQHLVRKLQGQAFLEAELFRLRTLLVNLRGKIDSELGSFPCQKPRFFKASNNAIPSVGTEAMGYQCRAEILCAKPQGNQSMPIGHAGFDKLVNSWEGSCQPPIVDCHLNGNRMVRASDHPLEPVDTLASTKNQGQ